MFKKNVSECSQISKTVCAPVRPPFRFSLSHWHFPWVSPPHRCPFPLRVPAPSPSHPTRFCRLAPRGPHRWKSIFRNFQITPDFIKLGSKLFLAAFYQNEFKIFQILLTIIRSRPLTAKNEFYHTSISHFSYLLACVSHSAQISSFISIMQVFVDEAISSTWKIANFEAKIRKNSSLK